MSSQTHGTLLAAQDESRTVNIAALRKVAFGASDTDQNGMIDEVEWHNAADGGQEVFGGSATPLDFREYDLAVQPLQRHPSTVSIASSGGPSPDGTV